MEQRDLNSVIQDPKVVTGCIVIVSVVFLAIAVGYYLGWGMFFMTIGLFLFWLSYRYKKSYESGS